MKKLMLAVAIVCAAVAAQAASVQWSTSGLSSAKTWYMADGITKVAADTAVYLIVADTISQGDLLAGLREGTIASIADKSVMDTVLNSSSQLTAKSITTPADLVGSHQFYMAALVDDKVFITDDITVVVQSTSNTSVAFSGLATSTKKDLAGANYSTSGWYDVAPEPTSGLMMLLGMGVLALRRRRA